MVDKGNHPQMALIQVLGVRKRSGVALIQVSEIWLFTQMLSRAVHFSELERLSSYVKARECTAKFNDGAPAGRARVGLGHQVPAGFPKIPKVVG